MKRTLIGAGVLALATLAPLGRAEASNSSGPYSVEIVVNGMAQPVYSSGGQAFVAGVFGSAYQIRVTNRSGGRIEAVVAIDGRDVVTGQPVDPRRHRGYIVAPWGSAAIDGFRSSTASVAAFRFTTIPRSYAWRTGTSWGIGTVRVWIFEESAPRPVPVLPWGAPGAAPRSSRGGSLDGMASEAAPSAPRDMGTEYGEQVWSPVSYTGFARSSGHARAVLGIRYQSREALVAAGIIAPAYPVPVSYPQPYPYPYPYPYPQPFAPPPPYYPY